ncbi:hypothetical protein ACTQ1O_04610 [Bilifractor sp. LCP21S3_A7]|uniref:hypothetical protein n=1 Tax=Bilifractor sp. LCP21S3_A7 TaxID=3438738 RepID=UPI003F8F3449
MKAVYKERLSANAVCTIAFAAGSGKNPAILAGFFYVNSEPRPNAKYSCAASGAIAR